MNIPEKLKLNTVRGPVTGKNGKDYCFATAETSSEGISPWSSIRWECIRQCVALPASWKVGSEVAVQIIDFSARDGQGRFDVPEAR